MRKIVPLFVLFALSSGVGANAQLKLGNKTVDLGKAAQAASDLATAITLSDEDVAKLSREAVEWMDRNNPVADETTEYGDRLKRLTDGLRDYDGLSLNFKVYHVVEVNAFACADGSIRVFSSLMDLMTDDELMAIIGHEIGHIKNSDVKDAIKTAYIGSAAKNGLTATDGKVAELAGSELGDFAMALTDAQFSQKQEYAADEYGFNFCIANGFDPYAMALSLEKLVQLSSGEKASALAKMMSTHPDSEKRAAAVRKKADDYLVNK